MKPSDSDLGQHLDALADGLDAGWDVDDAPASLSPHSAPLPAALDALDADWDDASSPARPSPARPSSARPKPARGATPAAAPGSLPLHVTKQERREAERRRRAHEAQQKALKKQQRKAERRDEARRSSEQNRAAERARGEQRERQAPAASPAPKRKQAQKRARHEEARAARADVDDRELEESTPPPSITHDRGAKKLILPLLIAILVAVTLGFALSRAH